MTAVVDTVRDIQSRGQAVVAAQVVLALLVPPTSQATAARGWRVPFQAQRFITAQEAEEGPRPRHLGRLAPAAPAGVALAAITTLRIMQVQMAQLARPILELAVAAREETGREATSPTARAAMEEAAS